VRRSTVDQGVFAFIAGSGCPRETPATKTTSPLPARSAPSSTLALRLRADSLETAINEADRRELVDPESLRTALDPYAGQPGVAALRHVLDRRTFVLTDSELERLFLRPSLELAFRLR
jgi:hypothetical protein